MNRLQTLAAALCGAAAFLACRALPGDPAPEHGPDRLRPAPTEHDLDEDEERRKRAGRERWIEEMHRTPPGVDWRAVERRNQEAARLRRNLLALGAPRPGGVDPWEEVGSRNQAGHTRCAAFGPERDGARWLYVGSALGGVWRGTMDGSGWTPLSDSLYGGVDDVVVFAPDDLADPDVVLARQGQWLYVSDDEGRTWEASDVQGDVTTVRAVARLDDASQTVLLLVTHTVSFQNKLGIYASTDQGRTFTERWSGINTDADFWVPRLGPAAANAVYLLTRGRLRVSNDGGTTFTLLAEIDASASAGRLAGSEAGAPTFYAALQVGGQWQLHRSDDGGSTFQYLQDLTDFWGRVGAFSSDPSVFLYGGVECWRSTDSGQSFQRINTWGSYYGDPANKLHADIQGIDVYPDPDQLGSADLCYIGTDGGMYVSTDWADDVHNLSLEGLGVGQFYSTHTSANDPDLIVGGTQDQGYQRGFRQPYGGSGPSTPFDQLISGDYGHLTSGDGTHRFLFSTYPGFVLIQKFEDNPVLVTADFPAGASNLWLPPVVADPLDRRDFFFLANQLWRYDKTGTNDWTPTLHSAQDFAAGPSAYLSAMAFAPSDPERAYACTNDGRLWYSTDHAVTWTLASSGPSSHYFYGNALSVHPLDPLEAVAGGSGYGTPGVRRTRDGGQTWEPLADGLPETLVYDVVHALDGSGDLYAATEAGAWVRREADGVWTDLMGTWAPATLYWSVEAVPAGGRIRFGTYGRGVWDYRIGIEDGTQRAPDLRQEPPQ